MKKNYIVITLILLGSLFFGGCSNLEKDYQEVIVKSEMVKESNGLVYKIKNDKLFTGRVITEYSKGILKSETYYFAGEKKGKSTTWYDDFSIKSISNYEKNLLEGEESEYFKSGPLKRKATYVNGKIDGKETFYDKNKVVVEVKTYVNGVLDGESIKYNVDGRDIYSTYKEGRLLNKKSIDKVNSKNYSVTTFDSSGEITLYENFVEDKLVESVPYLNGKKNGNGKFTKDGVTYTGSYSDDVLYTWSKDKEAPLYKSNIKYTGYLPPKQYVIIKNGMAIPKKEPNKESDRVSHKIYYGDKYEYLGETDDYYKFLLAGEIAFVPKKDSIFREFHFNYMYNKLTNMDEFLSEGDIKIISHYRNPTSKRNDKGVRDPFGSRGEQAGTAYYKEGGRNKFRYLHDRQYLKVIGSSGSNYIVKKPNDEREYKISKREFDSKDYSEEVKKALVIDKKSQNMGVFEKVDGNWTLISYSFINSGRDNGAAAYNTPSGEFSIAYSIPFITFLSTKEGSEDHTRAKFGIRFSGGGYVHTIPYKDSYYEARKGDITPLVKRGEQKLGIYPQSHKCVRNPQEHGEFLYDWLGSKNSKSNWFRYTTVPSMVISY